MSVTLITVVLIRRFADPEHILMYTTAAFHVAESQRSTRVNHKSAILDVSRYKPATVSPLCCLSACVCWLQVKEDGRFSPQIKLEPHEVDQFLNLSPKGKSSTRNPSNTPHVGVDHTVI